MQHASARMHSIGAIPSAAVLAQINATPFRYTAARSLDLFTLVVWAVKHQRATDDDIALHGVEAEAYARSQGYEPRAASTDGCWTLGQRGALGCSIDGGIVRGMPMRVHPDAQAVADRINALPARDRSVILRAARTGGPPAWIDPASQRLKPLPAAGGAGRGVKHRVDSRWQDTPLRSEVARQRIARGEPIVDRHGRSLLEREEKGFTFRALPDGRRQVLVKWCPVTPTPSAEFILSTNRSYSEWHASMVRLLAEMHRAPPLRDHICTGFSAPAPSEPWAE